MGDFRDLLGFKKSFELAMDIFEMSKTFPMEEKYSLTDQIRRSSRSVCANLAEAYRRRRYPAHFISNITDSNAENADTSVWLRFAEACKYLSSVECQKLLRQKEEVGRLPGDMIKNPAKYT